jgi:hypothetical protein
MDCGFGLNDRVDAPLKAQVLTQQQVRRYNQIRVQLPTNGRPRGSSAVAFALPEPFIFRPGLRLGYREKTLGSRQASR